MTKISFPQVVCFLTVAECLNFSEAARRLYITQPALGRQITAIEEELNMHFKLGDVPPVPHDADRKTPPFIVSLLPLIAVFVCCQKITD